MESILISVIVPVYKIEEYLSRCVDSIIGQTYKNLEIILVDDGSPDTCPQLCEEYARKDHRVKVVHKENGGLGPARNSGLDIATGEYIIFIDSDDWIESNMFEVLAKRLNETDADIVFSGYTVVVSTEKEFENIYVKEPNEFGLVETSKAAALMLHPEGYFTAVWNKMFRREAIFDSNGQYVPFHHIFGEDEDWFLRLLPHIHKVYLENKSFYMWWRRKNSISTEHLLNRDVPKSMFIAYDLAKQELNLFTHDEEFQRNAKARLFNTGTVLCDKLYFAGKQKDYTRFRREISAYYTEWVKVYRPSVLGRIKRCVKNMCMDIGLHKDFINLINRM